MRCLIPARGGSRRVRRKNLQPVDGVPLVVRAYRLAEQAGLDPVVSSEDGEIQAVCAAAELQWEDRPAGWAADGFEIDDLIPVWRERSGYDGPLVVLQPTTVGLRVGSLEGWLREVRSGYGVMCHAVDLRDLRTGLRFYPSGVSAARPFKDVLITGDVVDVDRPGDLASAQVQAESRTIAIVTGGPGYGHRRRTEQLAAALYQHQIVDRPDQAELTIFDKLDTSSAEVLEARRYGPVVTFEDDGPGADHADLVVNALYQSSGVNRVSGPDWAVIRPEFRLTQHVPREQNLTAENRNPVVMLSFGGTDPNNLTEKVRERWPFEGPYELGKTQCRLDVVEPQGKNPQAPMPHMAARMTAADLLITSCGRTLYEAAAVGVPTLCIAANVKETTHGHLGTRFGNMYLGHWTEGLGRLPEYVDALLGWFELRCQLSERARGLSDWKGLERIVWRIEGLLKGL